MSHERPNIVLITTDQQRFDTIRPHRPDWLRTPHLDDLAAHGVTFTNARSTCPVCVPARCTIMSGQHAWTHGLTANGLSSRALDNRRTLPARLGALGYHTQAIGKMHFGPQRARHGFDDCLIGRDYHVEMQRRGYGEHLLSSGLGQNEFYPGMNSLPDALTYTHWIANRCVDFLHDRRDPTRPFFLWCSFGKPHPPFDPPEPYYSMYRDSPIAEPVVGDWVDDDRVPRQVRSMHRAVNADRFAPEVNRAIRAAYYGLITQIDHALGRVFSALQDQKLLQETWIIFTSDHGEFLGDHRLMSKILPLAQASRVPMIVQAPRDRLGERVNTTSDLLVSLADLLPTLVAAAGGEVDSEQDRVEGRDLLEMLDGSAPPHDRLRISSMGDPATTSHGIDDGQFSYIFFAEGERELLFDHVADPLQTRDLSGDPAFAGTKAQLRQALVEALCRGSDGHPLVKDGELRGFTANDAISEREERSNTWLGYHTEHHQADVFH